MEKQIIGIIDIDRRPEVMNVIQKLDQHATLVDLHDLDRETLIEKLKDLDLLIIRLFPTDREILEKTSKIKAVIKAGVGVDHIDTEEATNKGIHVVVSTGNNISVAESAILLMLAVSRNLIYLNRNLNPDMGILGQELHGKKLGLMGFGRIGSHVSRIALALGMEVSVYDPYVSQEDLNQVDSGLRKTEFAEIIKESDYISMHCPLNKSTYHLLGESEFKQMKSSAIIINTARGAVLDEVALYDALKTGEIAGAGLDVFEEEPLRETNPLLGLDNVIATPHRLIQTRESLTKQTESIVDSALKILAGEIPQNSINKNKMDPLKDRIKSR